jgi:protein-L-isoaspartate(D-aspartate) O-methyltransferase
MTDFALARRHMVDGQVRTSGVTDLAVIEAMLAVPREQFVPEGQRSMAYLDLQVEMGGSTAARRRLMTAMTTGRLLQAAAITPDCSVLVVGCGTGYTVALVAHIGATVIATEPDAALATKARANLADLGFKRPLVVDAAPATGCAADAPFDIIILDGASERHLATLCEQLRPDGHLVGVFAETQPPQAKKLTRSADGIGYRRLFDALAPVLPGLERQPSFQF